MSLVSPSPIHDTASRLGNAHSGRNTLSFHHLEMCVANGKPLTSYFRDKLDFDLVACRQTSCSLQWVFGQGKSTFVVTQRQKTVTSSARSPFEVHCCENSPHHSINSVFNVALEVPNVDALTLHVVALGSRLIQPPEDVSDAGGTVRYSIVSSCCGNVVHTLLNKKAYQGRFLPTFEALTCQTERKTSGKVATTHLDHVAYVCRTGESQSIIEWHTKAFGMQRFMTNRLDDPFEGLKIESPIGMRLKAMIYWRSNENGIETSEENNGSALRVVVAESLAECPNGHIEAFLEQHKGPGLQHVALHSPSLPRTVKTMMENGLRFRTAPNAYYRREKEEEIRRAGEDPELFKQLGILLDSEADVDILEDAGNRFFLQIFTVPIFEEENFFFEMAQRRRARGFGSGNVTALARSIDEQRKLDQERRELVLGR